MTPAVRAEGEREISPAKKHRELDCRRRKSAINKLAIGEGPARATEGS
jgi:hypothetical protein